MVYDLWFIVYCIVFAGGSGGAGSNSIEHNGQNSYPIQNEAKNGMTGFRDTEEGEEDTGGSGSRSEFNSDEMDEEKAKQIRAARGDGRNIRTLGSNKKTKGVSCRRDGRRHIIYRASSGHVSISRERKAIFVVKLEKNDNRHKTKDYEQAYRKAERT